MNYYISKKHKLHWKSNVRNIAVFLVCSLLIVTLSPVTRADDAISVPDLLNDDYTIDIAYEYPITSADDEWLLMESHAERVAACQVPSEVLSNMTTRALVETIANYPLLVDMLLFNSATDAYQTIYGGVNSFRELASRTDALIELMNYIETNDEIQEDFVRKSALEVLVLVGDFASDNVAALCSDFGVEYTDAYAVYPELMPANNPAITQATAYSVVTPRTPSGSALTVDYYYNRTPELTQDRINALEEQVIMQYGLYPSADATVKYNCHSYAWHSQSTNNLWWITYPDDYIADPLVNQIITPSIGSRVVYQTSSNGRYTHSGIVTYINGSAITVKSKWGQGGLYVHSLYNCPSNYGSVVTYYTIG